MIGPRGRIVWLLQRSADLPSGDDWLGADERAVLDGLRFAKRREEWRLGRWTAKQALLGRLARPLCLERLEVRAAADGAPEAFVAGERLPVTISITHRDQLACCLVADAGTALGCDLEAVEARSSAFVADFFTPYEQERVAMVGAERRAELCALIWSAKESALKMLRTGLRRDTRTVEVLIDSPRRRAQWRALSVVDLPGGRFFDGWWHGIGSHHILTLVADPACGIPVGASPRSESV